MPYFIRWRGQVTGPHSEEAVGEMWNEGRLTRHHEVSVDGKKWDCLTDLAEFRVLLPREPPASGTSSAVSVLSPAAPRSSAPASTRLHLRTVEETPHLKCLWYYAVGQQVSDPVTFEALQLLVSSGTLSTESLVYPVLDGGAGPFPPAQWLPFREAFGGPAPDPWRAGEPATDGGLSAHPATASLALASFVLGLLTILPGLVVPGIPFAVGAVVTGHLARKQIRRSGGSLGGEGKALAGLIIGYTALVLSLLAGVAFLVWRTGLSAS